MFQEVFATLRISRHLDFDAFFRVGINRIPLESLACDLTQRCDALGIIPYSQRGCQVVGDSSSILPTVGRRPTLTGIESSPPALYPWRKRTGFYGDSDKNTESAASLGPVVWYVNRQTGTLEA